MKKSIKKNYIYNMSYQVLVFLAPLITTPYVSRVLEADGIGTYSYIASIVSYFVLFASMGISIYGQREISYVQDNKEKRSQVFWETKILEIITSSIAIGIYIIFSLTVANNIIYYICTFEILAILVNVTWFFQGIEEFGKIVFRNIIFKLLSILYIFMFVKTKADLWIYVFGMTFFVFLCNLSLWIYIPKYVSKPRWSDIRPARNLRMVIALFIPTIAIQIYTVLDKTMIGLITKDAFENGYYEQSIKISKLVLTVVTSLGTVMVPRIGYHFERGETDIVNNYMYRAYRFVWFIGIPLCFGLIGTASNFVPWFLGIGYMKAIPVLSILSFLIIAIGISNITGMQYFVPTKKEKEFTTSVLIGAAVNFILNMILISKFKSIGAAVASVSAEIVVTLVQLYMVRKELSFVKIVTSAIHYLIAGGIMLIILLFIGQSMNASIINTFCLIIIGASIYFLMLLLMRDAFFIENMKSVMVSIKNRINKQ
ncbi:Membrane protein involved in the export of O-antigen and teichoic acid [Pseudobutyrivibrio sp. C4]|uniref:flippase n=1 Tax=Pseudobutyrivibrio sp. C4 TaxID=1520803 RepID=UPI0008AB853D|nr:flippase [Pseudobutyrivibrio sp. C4]SET25723.1 Membrane protein involved in the export of O-antigen and teichoic acid [Pseudobutyrivibrio sp. C4]